MSLPRAALCRSGEDDKSGTPRGAFCFVFVRTGPATHLGALRTGSLPKSSDICSASAGSVKEGNRYRNLLWEGATLPGWAVFVPIIYVGLPTIAGSMVGRAIRSGKPWARWITGPSPEPRAWEQLFALRPAGVIRARLKSGLWIGGKFDSLSYAAGYPETPQDLFIEQAYRMNEDGSFEVEGEDYVPVGSGILVRWEEIEILEFFKASEVKPSGDS